MTGIDSQLGLMVWLINFLADRFGNHVILKGGMELRLLQILNETGVGEMRMNLLSNLDG